MTQLCLMWQAIVPSSVSILPEEIFCKNIPCTIFNINVVSAWGKKDKMCYFGKLE